MKSLALLPIAVLLVGCYSNNPDTLEYREVVVTPCCNQTVVKPCCNTYRTVKPCCGRTTTILEEEPIDVTTTNIDYY